MRHKDDPQRRDAQSAELAAVVAPHRDTAASSREPGDA